MLVRNAAGAIGVVPRTYVESGFPFQVQALYEYTPDEENYLAIQPGMILTATSENPDWYFGYTEDGKEGYFPISYVKRM